MSLLFKRLSWLNYLQKWIKSRMKGSYTNVFPVRPKILQDVQGLNFKLEQFENFWEANESPRPIMPYLQLSKIQLVVSN